MRQPATTTEGTTRALPCSCRHEYQDRRYGPGQRLHNRVRKIEHGWRCTVCGTARTD